MASVYWCRVVGDGLSPATAFRINLPKGIHYATLMISVPLARALIVSPDDTILAPNVNRLLTALTPQGLRDLARTTSPSAAQRSAVNTQLSAVGLETVRANMSWAEAIKFITEQVNPGAELDQTEAG